jgi:DNA-binding LacI/PurR family transcriptional regulator
LIFIFNPQNQQGSLKDAYFKTKGKDVIIHNEHQGAELAVKRLAEAGRKKIVFLTLSDEQNNHYSFKERQTGVEENCKTHNIEHVKTICCNKFFEPNFFDFECLTVAPKIAQELKDIDFDGAILYSNQLSGHFYEAMKILNKEIPKDCSVITFNYSVINRILRPRLASVCIPYEIKGQKIIERIVDLINNKDIKKEAILDYELKDWDSV